MSMTESSTALAEQSAAFGPSSHPAYSSFSHIGDVHNLSFAVGLREDEANAELFVQKILPMCRIVPGKPLEKRQRRAPEEGVEVLEVPEIVEMRERLANIVRGNEQLEEEHASWSAKLNDATENLQAMEKRIFMLDEEVDQLNEQLMEERNRSLVANMDAEAVKKCNTELNKQVQRAEVTIAKLEAELGEKTTQLEALKACSDLDMVFGASDKDAPHKDDVRAAHEVEDLDYWRRDILQPQEDDEEEDDEDPPKPRPHTAAALERRESFADRILEYKRQLRPGSTMTVVAPSSRPRANLA